MAKAQIVAKNFWKLQGTTHRVVTAVALLDKAGSYAVQEKQDALVTYVRGSYTNGVGLPLELVKKLLKEAAFPLGSLKRRAAPS